MRRLNYRTHVIPFIFGSALATLGCSSTDDYRYGLEDELTVTEADSLEGISSPEDTGTEDMGADGDAFDEDLSGIESDSAAASRAVLGDPEGAATVAAIEVIRPEPEDDSRTEEHSGSCPLNSGYPCACNATVCEDGSDCLAHGDSVMGFCSRKCGLNGGRSTCETSSYGLPEPPSGACAVIAQPESRSPDHCAVVCRQGDLRGDCPPHLVCTPAEGVDLHYCLPQSPSDDE